MTEGAAEQKTFVLVHGAFHGAWCWKDVARRLRALGHEVYTPTLTGLGERSHLMSFRPSLDTFIEDVAQVLRYEELERVILVGHSFSGTVVSGVADRMPERLRHLVYLDATVLVSGETHGGTMPPGLLEEYITRAMEQGNGVQVPPNPPSRYGITDPVQAAKIAAKRTPQPLSVYYDELTLRNPLGNALPATYIACSEPYNPYTASSRDRVKTIADWNYLEIPTQHNAMMLMPRELAEMLAAIGLSSSAGPGYGAASLMVRRNPWHESVFCHQSRAACIRQGARGGAFATRHQPSTL